jgi:hypothetical protein
LAADPAAVASAVEPEPEAIERAEPQPPPPLSPVSRREAIAGELDDRRAQRRGASGVDAVVCNSAIWQTDVQATSAAVRRVLRPGGQFVFNLAAAMLADHRHAGHPGPLIDAMKTIAARDYGWVPG